MEDNSNKEIMQIDVRKVIGNKNPKLLKRLPGFVINYIRRILHQDEINEFLKIHGHEYGIKFVDNTFTHFDIKYTVSGTENIDPSKKYIIASNHPLGGLDGIALIQTFTRLCGEVKFMVNDILMNLKNLGPFLIPINKHGNLSRQAAIEIDKTFRSDAQMLVFPSGFASRKIKGKITDLKWHKNFIVKAVKYERDVVPVHISGRNSNFFYNLANFRKRIRLKTNLEMFFLPDELFKQRNKIFHITIGNPIPYTIFDKSMKASDWANKVKSIVYELPNN